MSYKMIVLDLDDTLIKNDGTISKYTKDKLIDAQKRGKFNFGWQSVCG